MNLLDRDAKLALNIAFIGIALVLLVVAGAFAIPVIAAFGLVKAIQWYNNRPTPTAQIEAQTEERKRQARFPTDKEFVRTYITQFADLLGPNMPQEHLRAYIAATAQYLYQQEEFDAAVPSRPAITDPIEEGRYRDRLLAYQRKIANSEATLKLFTDTLNKCFRNFIAFLPSIAFEQREATNSPFSTVALVDAASDAALSVWSLIVPIIEGESRTVGLFQNLREALFYNLASVSGGDIRNPKTKIVTPEHYKGAPREMVRAYLQDTAFEPLFNLDLPFELPDEQRFAGMWAIAPPGRGKTTLLHRMVVNDLNKDVAIILMDSKGDLIEPFRQMKALQHRLILIEPDPANPIAINPLDIPHTDISQAVDLLEYLFGSLLEFKLTANQTLLFRSVLRLLITQVPNPTLETFRDILANGVKKYALYIDRCDSDLRDFFFNDFEEKGIRERRREVLHRLRLLLENDTMKKMLTADRTRFTFDDALDSGKFVIINNSKSALGEQGAEFFGRFFIAQILATAQRRSSRRDEDKKPVFFYIDECHNVISRDERIPTILDECRSQKVGLILAHQRTEQITSSNVLSALSNSAIRFANSDDEARTLAGKLRCTVETLQNLRRGQFAVFVRDLTQNAIVLSISKVDFSKFPRISPQEHAAFKVKMRKQYGSSQDGPIVNFNQRPPDMEPWRLDPNKQKKPPDSADPLPQPVGPKPQPPTLSSGEEMAGDSSAANDPDHGPHTSESPEW